MSPLTPTPPPPVINDTSPALAPMLDPTGFTSSFAGVVERPSGEFEEQYPVSEILAITGKCCHQLRCPPPLALPELVEGLARYRLASVRRS